jgi:dihydrofolate synthase/folylpolyglutamate synthase
VIDEIARLRCDGRYLGREFNVRRSDGGWWYQSRDLELRFTPDLPGRHQVDNLAGVLTGLSCLLPLSSISASEIDARFRGTRLAGRFEKLPGVLAADLYVDVGHNQDAARAIAASLAEVKPTGRCVALLGMLEDKRADLFVEALSPVVDDWWLLTLQGDRGLDASSLEARIGGRVPVEKRFASAGDALGHALSSLTNQDIMIVFGSFVTVESWLRAISESGDLNGYGSKH